MRRRKYCFQYSEIRTSKLKATVIASRKEPCVIFTQFSLTNKLDDYEQQLTKLRNEITQLRNENKDLTDTIFKRDH